MKQALICPFLGKLRDRFCEYGEDLSVVNVTVSDAVGREVPDAANLLRFEVNGDGRILGVGNGDPSSHEPDKCPAGKWQRSLFGGKCQIIVQSTRRTGTLELHAWGEGIQQAVVTISAGKAEIRPYLE